MTDLRSLERTLTDNLPWNQARIKFVARFLLALFSQRTVNLTKLATAFSGAAREASNYKQLQRFLHSFELPSAQVAHFVVQLLGEPGPYTLALDRTNWQVGTLDVNILLHTKGLARHRISARLVRLATRWELGYTRAHHADGNLP